MVFKLLTLLFICWNLKITESQVITVKIKSIKCVNINPELYNGSVSKCSIKPTRNGDGITNARYILEKPANDVWVHGKIYYKFFTGTRFQPWVIAFDEDICYAAKNFDKLSGFPKYFATAFNKHMPALIHPCPYFGEEGFKDGNVNKIMSDSIPQVVPRGTYRMLFRFHTKSNVTFLNVWVTAEVNAVDPLKVFDMG